MSQSSDEEYEPVLRQVLSCPPPLLPPEKSYHPGLTAIIAALQLHPTIEATLHLLNHDLPSAHFLVRHMQSAPAMEGMLLHAILHRIEGDYDNSRAWYSDVADDELGAVLLDKAWRSSDGGGKRSALDFVGEVERLCKDKQHTDEERLARLSRKEIMNVLEWCQEKFGSERYEDATSAWVRPSEKIQKMGQDQTTGGKGFRDF